VTALTVAADAEGAAEAAATILAPLVEFVRQQEIAEPGLAPFVVDHVEAVSELGQRDEAVELLDWYEGNARRLGRDAALAACLRCRALLAAQAGATEAAITACEEALTLHERFELPLERGRTLIVLGAAQRRVKRRREARETLEEALGLFERVGAALWAERARAELRRISGRAPAAGALTPAEERVAALVCEGRTNREVAAALYLSERTVEGHLSRVFGKLGVAHRNQLGPALAARQTQGITASNTGDAPVSADPVAP
jgi:DNA-binding CsgD family transcriptional regulator